jgi:hypothetical protein
MGTNSGEGKIDLTACGHRAEAAAPRATAVEMSAKSGVRFGKVSLPKQMVDRSSNLAHFLERVLVRLCRGLR